MSTGSVGAAYGCSSAYGRVIDSVDTVFRNTGRRTAVALGTAVGDPTNNLVNGIGIGSKPDRINVGCCDRSKGRTDLKGIGSSGQLGTGRRDGIGGVDDPDLTGI